VTPKIALSPRWTPNSWQSGWKPAESAVIYTFGMAKFTTSLWLLTFCPRDGGPFATSGISSNR